MPPRAKANTNGKPRYSFDKYRKEAAPSPDAFILDTGDGEIVVPYPGSKRLIVASRLSPNDAYGLLEALCGEQTDAILDLVADEPLSVLQALVTDIRDHFGLVLPEGGAEDFPLRRT